MKNKDDVVFNLIQNVFVGLAITLTVTIMTTGFTTTVDFAISFLKAYLINFIACIVIPTNCITQKLIRLLKLSESSAGASAVRTLICDIGYVTVISVVMFIWNLGFTTIAFDIWKKVYIPLLIVGFVVGFIMGPVSMKLTIFLNKKKSQ